MNAKTKKIQIWNPAILVAFVVALPSTNLAGAEWTRRTDMLTPRVSLSASGVDGKIYAIGGRINPRSGNSTVATVEEFDPAMNQWTRKASMPTGRYDLATAVVEGMIYAIGGFPAGPPTHIVEAYDPVTDTWTRRADLPTARASLSAGVVDGKIYTVGGGDSSIVEVYDPAADAWTRGTDMPTPRHPRISVVDGKIYAIGGLGIFPNWPALSVVEEYDPATDTWTRKADMPTPRHSFSTAVLDGRVYIVGGSSSDGVDPLAPVLAVEVYDPATDTWTQGPSMTTARIESSACAVDGVLYVLGGFQEGSRAFGALEVLDLNPAVDFNADGVVDIDDLLRLIESWGLNDPFVDISPAPWGDGIVDDADLEVLMRYYGQEPGLIAHWKLDETDGAVARDGVGGYDSALEGEPLWQPEGGVLGGALQFDGLDDSMETPLVWDPSGGPFSVFAWVQGGASGQVIVYQYGGANWLLVKDGGVLATELPPSNTNHVLTSGVSIADGNWHRVGLTWDGSTERLYVDDIKAAEADYFGLAGQGANLRIGAGSPTSRWSAATFFSGLIDDVRVYNRAIGP